ncbi:DnaJ domain-containing protein [Coxiella endosymbiont of Ornithodoros maritimus]|uniref:DnaJ domain-containing protein n=1 Tax=Coxiella endosymbiont of Ornithodoros maritimus TaxID=1656172 RepID=UPI0022641E5B|nr:DnaJ domain-containing protein [Coxiella endosymbiont of Ornithodoros maritimus]
MTSINRKVYYKKFNSRKDYYAVLALTSDASNEVMRKSYHKLVLIWHPDEWRKDKKISPSPDGCLENKRSCPKPLSSNQ